MTRALAFALAATVAFGLGAAEASEAPQPPAKRWTSDGPFGTFDRAAARRGLQVYREVCAACHSLRLVAYRHLGGIGLGDGEVKAIAASVEVQDGPNDQGEMFQRAGKPFDYFKSPFPNDQAARAANNGAMPPDLSLIAKARKGSADYLYALLVGYQEAPAGVKMMEGMNYSTYFPGQQIAMPNPLSDGQVSFADGTQATVDQMAKDVTTFLAWASEPDLEERKRLGVKVLIYMIVLTGMLYAVKRQIWARLH